MKDIVRKNKGIMLTGAAVILSIAIVVLTGLLASCSSMDSPIEAEVGVSSAHADESGVGNLGITGIVEDENSDDLNDDKKSEDVANSDKSTGSMQSVENPTSDGVQASSEASPGSSSSPSRANNPVSNSISSPQRKWVEDYERVWVEDSAAWTEQVPIYSTKEVSICNVCGADVSENATAHGKAHMLAGEGSGHHSEVRQTITGYNSIYHDAKGHYENRVVGGHWE